MKASRRAHLAPRIVFADGLSGTGKTALSFILSTLDRVEVHRIDPVYEQICLLKFMGRMETDAALALIRAQTDIAFYDSMIARGANFRPADVSSVLLKKDVYEKRLTLPDGAVVLERIRTESPILHLMTHQNLARSLPLFEALGERCFIIEMVRHPLFLITAWSTYIDRYGQDPLEFDVCIDHDGHDLPWFALGWEKEYLASSRIDRIILSLKKLFSLRQSFLESLDPDVRRRILIIPFERLVTDPWPWIEAMENLLGAKRTPLLEKVLKDQKIPRRVVTDVPDHGAFRKYGFSPIKDDATAASETDRLWQTVKDACPSDRTMKILEELAANFEKEYWI